MKKLYSILAMTLAAASFLGVSAAYAVPTLQLDIEGGTYDPVTGTIIASGTPFTLYALLTPGPNDSVSTMLAETYYVSAALTPQVSSPSSLGSFTFAGNTVNVTSDMTYGTPPIATVDQDLPSHGIFPTYFSEFAFQFSSANQIAPYNTATQTGGTAGGGFLSGTGTYWASFGVDVSALSALEQLHFDLYTYGDLSGNNNKTGITEFAPFSHDAQSAPVPEPATMLLFGTGLVGLAGMARKKIQ